MNSLFPTPSKVWVFLIASLLVSCTFVRQDDTNSSKNPTHGQDISIQRKDLSGNIYEILFDKATDSLFAAANKDGAGVIFRLDPNNLHIKQQITLDSGSFSLALNKETNTLYVGHSLDQSVTAINAKTGEKLASIEFNDEIGADARTRELVAAADYNLLFVSGEGGDGVIWVLDGTTLAVKQILQQAGGLGLAYQKTPNLLYSTGAKVLKVFDVNTFNIRDVASISDVADSLLLNLTIDSKRNFAYVSDFNSNSVLVIDLNDMSTKQRFDTATGPVGILYNSVRDEIYVANRQAGKVSVYDANDYKLLKQFSIEQYPNSLSINDTGKILYVSVKKDAKNKSIHDAVVRIDLTNN